MIPVFLTATVLLTAVFTFLNGFRDVSSAVAFAVRSRALTASVAVLQAALFNLIGVVLAFPVAAAVGTDWMHLPSGTSGLSLLVSALASGIVWNILTWWKGMPSSSTHALFGGLFGAGLAATLKGGNDIPQAADALWTAVGLPLLVSPVAAFVLSYALVWPVMWIARNIQPSVVNRRFRRAQAITAGAVAFGHGLQDGQRTFLVMLAALLAAGYDDGQSLAPMLVALVAGAMTVGTLFGGWRISHTLGHRMIRVDPLRGFVTQAVGFALQFAGAIGLGWPISTTHTMTAGMWGAGSNQRFPETNRKVMIRILGYWVATPLATVAMAFIVQMALTALL
ncbi:MULTISPECIES: inorganic phosphate transporter [Arthrobacter]|uniref:Inorganic phosphate transporter n=2 Tax=Arthrobacter TaxID=1663 RepID=A0ABU9KKV2_9MICC|nr:inorganic phosphate transporter [Arthrobacter sp. YJM1]MDP5227022.1 anion permease [Arthrobacter sp. YJM1]